MIAGADDVLRGTANVTGRRVITQHELDEILASHKKWLDTDGRDGVKADLSDLDLRGLLFKGKSLKGTNLQRTNLSGVDFQNVEFCDANLCGAIFHGADLSHAKGIVDCQLAATDLSNAHLPADIGEFPILKQVTDTSDQARTLLWTTIGACLFAGTTVFVTTDAAILARSGSTLLPLVQISVPILGFFLLMPLILLALYFYLHFHLQFLWNELARLPSVFPDGTRLDERADPLFLVGQARRHKPILKDYPHPLGWLQCAASVLSAWALVPFTLFLFWLRHLRMHDLWIVWHILLFTAATGFGVAAYILAMQTLNGERSPGPCVHDKYSDGPSRFAPRVPWVAGTMAVAVIACALVSAAAFSGWTSYWDCLRQQTCADLSYGEISYRPSDRQRSPDADSEALKDVRGTLLNGVNLSGAKAIETFLASADLRDACLFRANLSGADLRRTWLMGANLREALLVNTKLGEAILKKAQLQCAELRNAELSGADLSQAKLMGANLYGARLDRARLAYAELQCEQACCGVPLQKRRQDGAKTTLCSARLERADLTGAWLEGADLGYANLERAVLKETQFKGAKLERAQLARVDLAGARLWEANFKNADFSEAWFQDTELHGADLSEAKNLDDKQLEGAYCDQNTKLPATLSEPQKCQRKDRRPWSLNKTP